MVVHSEILTDVFMFSFQIIVAGKIARARSEAMLTAMDGQLGDIFLKRAESDSPP
jgi:hypothetical protein